MKQNTIYFLNQLRRKMNIKNIQSIQKKILAKNGVVKHFTSLLRDCVTNENYEKSKRPGFLG